MVKIDKIIAIQKNEEMSSQIFWGFYKILEVS